jgi:arylsulfatase A-like enzyme
MKRLRNLFAMHSFFKSGLACLAGGCALAGQASQRPMNVVLILADDLGWADTTLYGKTDLYRTPNLERLAKRGMVFTRAYSASPLCSPTRASILTGQDPARNGFTSASGHLEEIRLKPEIRPLSIAYKMTQTFSVSRLDTSFPTLGKLIHAQGVATAHFGKWHLGAEPYSPLEHGFDVDLPHWSGPGPAGSYVAPWQFPDFSENTPKEHIEDRMAQEAVRWLQSLPKEQPFFMNYWQFSVHAPFDAKQELIEKYKKQMNPAGPQRSPTYAAMVESMDNAVGTLLDAVDAAGVADRTVIIFMSDNGGNMYNRVDGVSPTSNAPLRGGKATLFEGGIRVPCVIVWPGVAEPGSRSDEIIHSTDIYPTILHAMNIPLPENYSVDGVELSPALTGGALNRNAIFSYFPHVTPKVPDWLTPAIAVHSGDWKLIRLFYQGECGAHDYLLYNLADDIAEAQNLAAAYPEKTAELDQMIEQYLANTDAVIPVLNPDFDPAHYHPERIGVPVTSKKPFASKKEKSSVDGWKADGTASLIQGDGTLIVNSTGNDPRCIYSWEKTVSGGPFTVSARMKFLAAGGFRVYYTVPYRRENSAFSETIADGQWREIQMVLQVNTFSSLRLDPAGTPGTVMIDWIRIDNAAGNPVQRWDF